MSHESDLQPDLTDDGRPLVNSSPADSKMPRRLFVGVMVTLLVLGVAGGSGVWWAYSSWQHQQNMIVWNELNMQVYELKAKIWEQEAEVRWILVQLESYEAEQLNLKEEETALKSRLSEILSKEGKTESDWKADQKHLPEVQKSLGAIQQMQKDYQGMITKLKTEQVMLEAEIKKLKDEERLLLEKQNILKIQ